MSYIYSFIIETFYEIIICFLVYDICYHFVLLCNRMQHISHILHSTVEGTAGNMSDTHMVQGTMRVENMKVLQGMARKKNMKPVQDTRHVLVIQSMPSAPVR